MKRVEALKGLLPNHMGSYYKTPLLIDRGEMQFLYDADGKKYLDMFAGIVTVSVGHCHPKVNAAMKKQADKLWHTTSIYLTTPIYEYAKKLTDTLPDHLKVCFFVNSGSEANDLAIELARLHTGRFDVLAMRNGYHGMTQSVLGCTNLGTWKQPLPSGFGILKAPCPDTYHGPWGGSKCRDSPVKLKRECHCLGDECQASRKYFKEFEEVLNYDFPASTGPAAFLVESIQGVGGTMQFPKGFLQKAFKAVHKREGLCISDEVQTGFGRLGSHFWGFEAHGIRPDIVTMAKGIGNGYPMGAVVTTKEIAASLGRALYFNTFGGNPIACAVGSAVLDVIKEEKLQENADKVGTHFLKQLATIDSPLIGDVRGKGLMIGVELTGGPLPRERMTDIFDGIKDRGVLVGKGGLKGNVLRIKPPMCVTKQDADQTVEVIADTLKKGK